MENKKTRDEIIDKSLKKNSDVVSSTDLTGLVSSSVEDESQVQAYKDIAPGVKVK